MVLVEVVEEAVGDVVGVFAAAENGAGLVRGGRQGRRKPVFALIAEQLFLTVAGFLVFGQSALTAVRL